MSIFRRICTVHKSARRQLLPPCSFSACSQRTVFTAEGISRKMTEGNSLLFGSMFATRPPVSTRQAEVMAARLFNLNIADPSSIKELDSYQDRNFYMRGSLMREEKEMGVSLCKEYVLKIVNHFDSNHECLIEVQGKLMLFLQARDYNCSTPVLSIFQTFFVMCKIPTGTQPGGVALETDLGLVENKISVNNAGNFEDGIEIYDGKEYCEEEYFVCAVLLLNFVPGQMLNEIPLSTELLFNAGMAVGSLDRDLKEFGCSRLDRPGLLWDMSRIGDNVERCLQAVDDKHHVKMVQEVCESFRKEVAPKLHLLSKQIIHGDANYTNTLVTPEKEIGFIDFGDINYSCRIFELAIALMYILNVDHELSCGRTRMAGYFFAGYHSVNPLSNEEIDLLHVLVASRFCQSLVFGAYTSKFVDPGNEYILETARNGWKNFEALWKMPKKEMLKIWLEMSEK